MKLTPTEEKLMHFIWARKKAFLKDLLHDFPAPVPAKTTVATLLKRLTDKGFISYKEIGSKREYYPLVKKSAYSSGSIRSLVKNFFDDSAMQLASFCTTETGLTETELQELRSIIDEQLKKRKK